MEQPAEYIDANENDQKKILTAPQVYSTHKTKLKPDKEVGGGDLVELCTTITIRIVYPYAWTINFEICIQNTPTSDSNNFSTWSLE